LHRRDQPPPPNPPPPAEVLGDYAIAGGFDFGDILEALITQQFHEAGGGDGAAPAWTNFFGFGDEVFIVGRGAGEDDGFGEVGNSGTRSMGTPMVPGRWGGILAGGVAGLVGAMPVGLPSLPRNLSMISAE